MFLDIMNQFPHTKVMNIKSDVNVLIEKHLNAYFNTF